MKFSLVYTSRRAGSIESVIRAWLTKAAVFRPDEIEIVVGIDQDYAAGFAAVREIQKSLPHVVLVANDGPATCVAGWNAAAAASTGDALIAIADDFEPADAWDKELMDLGAWWEKDSVVAVSDGYNPDLFTLVILSRKRYNRFGYLLYPCYESLFSDTEFTYVARQEGVVIDARHLLFEHMHPDAGKRARDEVDLCHASSQRWKRGEMLFNLRRDTGFPLDAGPAAEALEASYADLKFAAYVQAIRDDFCLADVIEAVLASSSGKVKDVFICAPDEYWGGNPQSASDRAEINAAVNRLRDSHRDVLFNIFPQSVAPHRLPGLSRIAVETSIRNDAVNRIRAQGFQHIIVLDGDELWRPTLFPRLVDFIREFRPASVFTGMIPVIGLPGYPVEGAVDKASIYLGPGSWFAECRGAGGHRHELPSQDVIHFTGTRRTREEIESKMRESGHADDPNYHMERWITDILPNIQPGYEGVQWTETNKGLHMFLPYQIWKSVRQWTPAEWSFLPEAVKPCMGSPLQPA